MLAMFVTLKVKPGRAEELEALFRELIPATNGEPGNLLYMVGKGEAPDTYYMMERYVDKQALKAHFASPHFQKIAPKLNDCLQGDPEPIRFSDIEP